MSAQKYVRGTLYLKSINEEDRTFRGIASSNTKDLMGDIVVPTGALYKLPLPLLWMHDSRSPIGHVFWAKPNAKAIEVKCKIFKASKSEKLKERLDEAWESVATGLVKGLSIGFTDYQSEPLKNGGQRFTSWYWHELSVVSLPANCESEIARSLGIVYLDRKYNEKEGVVYLNRGPVYLDRKKGKGKGRSGMGLSLREAEAFRTRVVEGVVKE
jgi:hypothetical protein